MCDILTHSNAEKNANLYNIKMDVPINYIHPGILLNALRKGLAERGFGPVDERERFVKALYDIQLKRYQNFSPKYRVTHTIFTYEAMLCFVTKAKGLGSTRDLRTTSWMAST